MLVQSPERAARPASTAWTNGRSSATRRNGPPTISKSNHVPERSAAIFVNNAPQMPPTCLSLKSEPHRRPREIKKMLDGMRAAKAARTVQPGSRPRQKPVT